MFTLQSAVSSSDPSWENIGAAIWSAIELNTSIICSCLPTLRPLLAKWMPGGGLSSVQNDRSTYQRYGSASGAHRSAYKETKSNLRSISSEEMALKDLAASQANSMPAVYSHISAERESGNGRTLGGHGHKNIMVTTEMSVREGL
jgi:hypothetical protein